MVIKVSKFDAGALLLLNVGTLDRSYQLSRVALEVTLWTPVLRSLLWDHVIVKHLHTNMRVQLHGDEAAGKFANQFLDIGDGKHSIDTM